MYTTQSFPLDQSEIKTAISPKNGPSPKKLPTSFKEKDERTCCIFIFDVVYF